MKHIISGIAVLTISAGAAFAHGAGPGTGAEFAHQPSMATMHTMSTPAASHTTSTPAAPRPTASSTATQPGSARTTTTSRSSKSTTTHTTGQPNASCEETPTTPGNSASAPGSAFNPNGVSGTKYAGEQPQNSNNPAAVSQYDVACANQPH